MNEPVAYLYWYKISRRYYLFCPPCYKQGWNSSNYADLIFPVHEDQVQKFKLQCESTGCNRLIGSQDGLDFCIGLEDLPSPENIRGENSDPETFTGPFLATMQIRHVVPPIQNYTSYNITYRPVPSQTHRTGPE